MNTDTHASQRHEQEPPIRTPWSLDVQEIVEKLDTDSEKGLSPAEAKRRRKRYGPNRLRTVKAKSAWAVLVDQVKNLIVGLLAAAAIGAFLFGQHLEGVAVLIAIFINIIIGFVTELRAVRSMEALRKMGRIDSVAVRSGKTKRIAAENLVPGDLVRVEAGDVVSADARLVKTENLQVNEAALTGESVPVEKQVEPVDEDAETAERESMLMKGTVLTSGAGLAVITATGTMTELGRIAELTAEAESSETPLEKRLDVLGRKLIRVTLIVAAITAGIGIATGLEPFIILETSVALAVAAIPEGLPIVAGIALAKGMYRMSRRNALMNRLSSVETLGSVSVIFSDKTGTLTENRMEVDTLAQIVDKDGSMRDIPGKDVEKETPAWDIIKVGMLCNDAELPDEQDSEEALGDPMEAALLHIGREYGLKRAELLESMPEERQEPFTAETKMVATYHKHESGYLVAVKGAPEQVLQACSQMRTQAGEAEMTDALRTKFTDHYEEMASQGLRILAAAEKTVDDAQEEPYKDLIFLGLIGLKDPPRDDVAPAVEELRRAGVRVVMVTGDHPATARNIGRSLKLFDDGDDEAVRGKELKPVEELSEDEKERLRRASIFSRVSPEQKLDLISLHQDAGKITAMTGDGVNDAPALKKADIGVAMGKRGTQAAKETADMVLKDDRFSTIVTAVRYGRVIFGNIRKFILFLLSGNVGEIMIVAGAIAAGLGLVLYPLQILYLNMLGDVFPALALGLGEEDEAVMSHQPRDPSEPIINKKYWTAIFGYGLLIAVTVLAAYHIAGAYMGMGKEAAVTVAFLTLSFGRLWHTFNMRDTGSRFIVNAITANPYVWGALVICVGLLLLAVHLPVLADALKIVPPDMSGWTLILGMSLVPFVVGQVLKTVKGVRKKHKEAK